MSQVDTGDFLLQHLLTDASVPRPVRLVEEGSDSWTFFAGEDWVLRFPRNPEVRERLILEGQAMAHLAPLILNRCPQEYRWTESGGSACLWHRKVQGLSGEAQSPPSEGARHDLARQVAETLLPMHTLDPEELPIKLSFEPPPDLRALHSTARSHFSKASLNFDQMPESAIHLLERELEDTDEPVMAICHGDIKGEHVILDAEGRLSGFIDWTDLCVTDLSWDFAGLSLWLGPSFVDVVLSNYPKALKDAIANRSRLLAQVSSVERLGRKFAGEHSGPLDLLLRQMHFAFSDSA